MILLSILQIPLLNILFPKTLSVCVLHALPAFTDFISFTVMRYRRSLASFNAMTNLIVLCNG